MPFSGLFRDNILVLQSAQTRHLRPVVHEQKESQKYGDLLVISSVLFWTRQSHYSFALSWPADFAGRNTKTFFGCHAWDISRAYFPKISNLILWQRQSSPSTNAKRNASRDCILSLTIHWRFLSPMEDTTSLRRKPWVEQGRRITLLNF